MPRKVHLAKVTWCRHSCPNRCVCAKETGGPSASAIASLHSPLGIFFLSCCQVSFRNRSFLLLRTVHKQARGIGWYLVYPSLSFTCLCVSGCPSGCLWELVGKCVPALRTTSGLNAQATLALAAGVPSSSLSERFVTSDPCSALGPCCTFAVPAQGSRVIFPGTASHSEMTTCVPPLSGWRCLQALSVLTAG